jgi:hypothetical protein
VSFISRCHRAGLTEQQAMRLVNHSSRLVHRIYSRLNVEDARLAMQKVPLPPSPPVEKRNPSPSARSSCVRKRAASLLQTRNLVCRQPDDRGNG